LRRPSSPASPSRTGRCRKRRLRSPAGWSASGPGGSAPATGIPDYLVAGKTGTAQRASATGGYEDSGRTISFVGFAPADAPRFVTYVVLDNPSDGSFGGTGAGPVFRDIMAMVLQKYGVEPTGAEPADIPLEW
jgi:cell division protein FtsI (penicillin-binding protein 3)